MAKTPTEIASLARSHSEAAINVLRGIMNEKKAPYPARVAAASAILDRGLGKPVQAIQGTDGPPIAMQVTAIEHTIVRPEDGKAKTKDG